MKTHGRHTALVLAGLLAAASAGAARGQQAPAAASRAAEVDALEPAVDVGARGGPAAAPAAAAAPRRAAAALGSTAAAAAPEPNGARSRTPAGPVAEKGAAPEKGGAMDRVDLGTTSITGNQELPKVLTIVPWKRSDLGEVVGRPVNTLLDEVLAPVDPDVFKRHLEYYGELFDSKRQRSPSPDTHD